MTRRQARRSARRERPLFDADVDSLLTHTADLFGVCPTCSVRAGRTIHWPCPGHLSLADVVTNDELPPAA